MSGRAFVLLLCCALAACRESAPAPAATGTAATAPAASPPPATPDYDADNSLNLMWGGALVSRGGELHLETSAVHTIDGFAATVWTSAPGTPADALVYSMLSPTRLRRVGVSTTAGDDAVESVTFDASMDGKTWTTLATLKTAPTDERQLVDVEPTVAHYLRVRTGHSARYYVRLRGVHAIGEEVGPPRTPPFAGCWTINGERAWIEQNGARLTGVIESDPPTYLDGGTDNRAGMVMWLRGGAWGYAVLTRSPDGRHLSGLSFFEDVDMNVGEGWFGERCSGREEAGRRGAGGTAAGAAALQRIFARAKHLSLYGLVFDGHDRLVEELSAPTLDVLASLIASSSHRMSVVAHELRHDTPEENRRHTAARLQGLRAALERRGVNLARIDFVAAGDDAGIVLHSSLQRFLVSRVDLVSGT